MFLSVQREQKVIILIVDYFFLFKQVLSLRLGSHVICFWETELIATTGLLIYPYGMPS